MQRWRDISLKLLRFIVRHRIAAIAAGLGLALYWFSLPPALFSDPYSSVLFSADGRLLSASIAADGQWRFPASTQTSEKFATALIAFEDRRFRSHPGVDVLALCRAIRQNIQSGTTISGASTITMQVIRLARKQKERTLLEKIIEAILATRLELKHSKSEILSLYAAHAPFGGNVVGLEAACWRYFGTSPDDLSWAQAALLAVLPNSPSLIHPGKNRSELRTKRDRLLAKLRENGIIDELTCDLAMQEQLPEAPLRLPKNARHLLFRAVREQQEKRIVSTINYDLQLAVEDILRNHHGQLSANQIFNGAAIVLDVRTGKVLAYAGNTDAEEHEGEVDIITSPRSTGSILKPILYAAMLDEGKILPQTILPDVPLLINGFAPRNFSHQFDGAVAADQALIRSLNVPAVHLLRDYRYEKFHALLRRMGMSTLKHAPDHYGLSLILGGAEATLWDITGMYASMARTLVSYFEVPGAARYRLSDYHAPFYVNTDPAVARDWSASTHLGAASIYFTFEALKEVFRPGEVSGWRHFTGARNIAWKTGTSFGHRDGWAVGVTPEYAVGVWIGNADGEGRPGLTGTEAAAPVLFDIFGRLKASTVWFNQPAPETREISVCRQSGHRVSPWCADSVIALIPVRGLSAPQCPYHRIVHLSEDLQNRVHDRCASLAEMKHVSWFILPPVQEYYYRTANPGYHRLPPLRSDCANSDAVATMDMIYPANNTRIFIPRELDGQSGASVFEVAHRRPATAVYWHLDGIFIGSTRTVHQLPLNPAQGRHVLTVVDDDGVELSRTFEVISPGINR